MYKNRILFLVDHKHRDLPSLALIAFQLHAHGDDVRLVALGSEEDVVQDFDPHFIVIPKPNYNFARLYLWKLLGRKIIVVDSEGNHQDKNLTMRIKLAPDLYCFWNAKMKRKYEMTIAKRGGKSEVLGFYRGDLLHAKYRGIYGSGIQLREHYGVPEDGIVITVATSTQDSHFSEKRRMAKSKRRARTFSKTAPYRRIVENMIELRTLTEDFVFKMSKEFPGATILVKPHPNENAAYWHDLINKVGNKNLKLVVGEPINQMLQISNFHISHNVCTTTIEAMLVGVPTAEIHTDQSEHLYDERHLHMADFVVRSWQDLKASLNHAFKPAQACDSRLQMACGGRLQDYVDDFLYKFDGHRCEEYADYLSKYMKAFDSHRKVRYGLVLVHPWLTLMFLGVTLRAWMADLLRAFTRSESIEELVNYPDRNKSHNYVEIDGMPVHKEFGLYDNRMRLGDELLWYEKFKSATKEQ